jgi:transcriptional regulator with XRE-family HTH domain
MSKRESIGQRIKSIRVDQQLKAKDLAKAAGINASSLSLIENNRRTPDTKTLDAIARALQTTIAKLMDGASLNTGGPHTSRTDEPTQAPAPLAVESAELARIVRDAVAAAYADIFVTLAAALGDHQAKDIHGEVRSTESRASGVPRKNRG